MLQLRVPKVWMLAEGLPESQWRCFLSVVDCIKVCFHGWFHCNICWSVSMLDLKCQVSTSLLSAGRGSDPAQHCSHNRFISILPHISKSRLECRQVKLCQCKCSPIRLGVVWVRSWMLRDAARLHRMWGTHRFASIEWNLCDHFMTDRKDKQWMFPFCCGVQLKMVPLYGSDDFMHQLLTSTLTCCSLIMEQHGAVVTPTYLDTNQLHALHRWERHDEASLCLFVLSVDG